MLGCHVVAVDGTDLGEDLLDEALVERNAFAALRASFDFCRKHLTQPVHLDGLQAEVGLEIPELVIREALANAFAHRDYATAGRVQVRVYSDRLEVVSPGGLHFGLTTSDRMEGGPTMADGYEIAVEFMDMTDDRHLWARATDARRDLELSVGRHVVVGDYDADPRVARIVPSTPTRRPCPCQHGHGCQ